MNMGIIGGIVGSIIGLIGGIIGTYFSIKNTNSSKEKAFMIKVSILGWIGIIVFLAPMFLLPSQYRFYLWVPYGTVSYTHLTLPTILRV